MSTRARPIRRRPPRIAGHGCFSKGGGGGGGAPGTPTSTVNPTALGQASLQANVGTAETQARLNNLSTFSPYGSTVFAPGAIDPTTGMPSSYNVTQALSPTLSGLFNTQTGVAQGVANAGAPFTNYAPSLAALGYPALAQAAGWAGQLPQTINLSGVPNLSLLTPSSFQTGVTTGPGGQPLPNVASGVSGATLPIASTIGPAGPIQSTIGPAGPIQTAVGVNSADLVRQAQNAAYGAQTQYLDPQFAILREQNAQNLRDTGATPQAQQLANDQLARDAVFAYQSAQNAAVGAGNAQEQALYQQALQGGEFANQAQQQGFGQQVTAQQVANAAQQQQFGQLVQGGAFANAAQAQQYAQALQNAQLTNAAQGQLFGQGLSLADLFNQAVQGATQLNVPTSQANLARAQAAFGAPFSAVTGLTGAGGALYGTGIGSLAQLLPAITAWPTGATAIPNLAPGTATGVSPANIVGAQQASTLQGYLAQQAGQQSLANLVGGTNLASQALFGNSLFGGGGTGGGGGLFSGGGGLLGAVNLNPFSSTAGGLGAGEFATAGGGVSGFAIPGTATGLAVDPSLVAASNIPFDLSALALA